MELSANNAKNAISNIRALTPGGLRISVREVGYTIIM
jgi:hypothetical protein